MRTSITWMIFAILISVTLLQSCKKDKDTEGTNPTLNPDPIEIACLMVGQQSRFIRLTGEKYYMANDTNITYHPDTLVMEVIDEDNGVFTLSEALTPASNSVVYELLPYADTTYLITAYIDQDTLWLEPKTGEYGNSWFFTGVSKRNSFYSQYHLSYMPLMAFGDPEVDFLGWKTTMGYGESYMEGHMVNQTLLGTDYPFLNVMVDNSDMAFDGPGYTLIYEPKGRLVRSTVVNWWTQSGGGWDGL